MSMETLKEGKSRISIVEEPISLMNEAHEGSGSRVTFYGIVRPLEDGRKILHIHYECYHEMAMKSLESIVRDAESRFHPDHVNVTHRIGDVKPGEESVVVDVFTSHRKDGFSCCSYIMDRIKKETPIWKCFYFLDGSSQWK